MRLVETAKSTKHEGRGSDEEMSEEEVRQTDGQTDRQVDPERQVRYRRTGCSKEEFPINS